MAYFARFPLVRFDDFLGVNMTTRTKIQDRFKEDVNVYFEHEIKDGETPEIIADKFYDDAELAWVILIFNEIHNVYADWPQDSNSLNNYINDKYVDPNGIHHYESIATGAFVDETHVLYDRIPVTNTEYEINLNESKRSIKLILPELVGSVISQHNQLVSRGI